MQIQKGLVKYKDRTDIVCSYGVTDDGKQYYFLDDKAISNGNIIASTALVEAIDPVVSASSVGVINRLGEEVIPLDNRSVKVVLDNVLLVEKTKPVTPSVIEASKSKSNPLAATRLVTTAAAIKEKLSSKIGSDGRFIFNDQFSEATLYDFEGKNLVNDEFYSFIGMTANGILFLSKNVVDSPIVEFVPGRGVVTVDPGATGDKLDVKNASVTQESIDGAIASTVRTITPEHVQAVLDGDTEVLEPPLVTPDTEKLDESNVSIDYKKLEESINREVRKMLAGGGITIDHRKLNDSVNNEIRKMLSGVNKGVSIDYKKLVDSVNSEVRKMLNGRAITIDHEKLRDSVNEEVRRMLAGNSRIRIDYKKLEEIINQEVRKMLSKASKNISIDHVLLNESINQEVKKMLNSHPNNVSIDYKKLESSINEEVRKMLKGTGSVIVNGVSVDFKKVQKSMYAEIRRVFGSHRKVNIDHKKLNASVNNEVKKMLSGTGSVVARGVSVDFKKVQKGVNEEVRKMLNSMERRSEVSSVRLQPAAPKVNVPERMSGEVKTLARQMNAANVKVDFKKVQDSVKEEVKKMVKNAQPVSPIPVQPIKVAQSQPVTRNETVQNVSNTQAKKPVEIKEVPIEKIVSPIETQAPTNVVRNNTVNYIDNSYGDEEIMDSALDFKRNMYGQRYEDNFSNFGLASSRIDRYVDSYLPMPGRDSIMPGGDSIMEDVASTMNSLISLNRKQKQQLMNYEARLNQAANVNRQVVEQSRNQGRDIETLKNRLKNYEAIVARLESKNQLLESRVHDLDRAVVTKTNEVESLKSQLGGNNELARVLADAQILLDQVN